MDSKVYQIFVKEKLKPGADILEALTPVKANLLHCAVGVSGEAGELLDAFKRHCIFGKELDRKNVIEELGDIEFYLEGIRTALSIARDDVLRHNVEKLSKRHVGKYTDAGQNGRADKLPGFAERGDTTRPDVRVATVEEVNADMAKNGVTEADVAAFMKGEIKVDDDPHLSDAEIPSASDAPESGPRVGLPEVGGSEAPEGKASPLPGASRGLEGPLRKLIALRSEMDGVAMPTFAVVFEKLMAAAHGFWEAGNSIFEDRAVMIAGLVHETSGWGAREKALIDALIKDVQSAAQER